MIFIIDTQNHENWNPMKIPSLRWKIKRKVQTRRFERYQQLLWLICREYSMGRTQCIHDAGYHCYSSSLDHQRHPYSLQSNWNCCTNTCISSPNLPPFLDRILSNFIGTLGPICGVWKDSFIWSRFDIFLLELDTLGFWKKYDGNNFIVIKGMKEDISNFWEVLRSKKTKEQKSQHSH